MALGKQNRQIEGKTFSLKLKLKDGEKFADVPFFEVSERTDEKDAQGKYKYNKIGRETDVAGDLVFLETRVGEYEGNPVRSFTLGLQDNEKNEAYFVGVSLGSGVGRGLANSILNLKNFNNVQLGSYAQVNKDTKKSYGAVSLRQGDDSSTVKWKYDPKAANSEFPAPREFVGKGNKMERDYTAQEEFLVAKLNEFAKVVEADAKARRSKKSHSEHPQNPEETSAVAGNVDESDQPPF